MFGQVPQAIRDYVRQALMPLVRYRRMVRSDSGGGDELTGHPAGPGEPRGSDQCRRMQHYGFRSTPPDGAELLTVAVGGAAGQHVSIASDMPGAGPQSQPGGEAEIYTVHGQRFQLDKDGAVLLTTQAGASVTIDKDGNVTVTPASGKTVSLGSEATGSLDYVVLFTALKSYLESHTHQPGSFTTPTGGSVSGASGNANESFTAHSSNVLAKK